MRKIKIPRMCVKNGEKTIKKGHRRTRSKNHTAFEGFRGGAYICVLYTEFMAKGLTKD